MRAESAASHTKALHERNDGIDSSTLLLLMAMLYAIRAESAASNTKALLRTQRHCTSGMTELNRVLDYVNLLLLLLMAMLYARRAESAASHTKALQDRNDGS
jgi:hypothetical protein